MKLKDYLDDLGIPIATFARKLNVSRNTLHNIIKGQDIRLSIALKIEELTKGQVTCHDLETSSEQANKKQDAKSNKKKSK
jgi:plasmid maintenance system antidote protein VapI